MSAPKKATVAPVADASNPGATPGPATSAPADDSSPSAGATLNPDPPGMQGNGQGGPHVVDVHGGQRPDPLMDLTRPKRGRKPGWQDRQAARARNPSPDASTGPPALVNAKVNYRGTAELCVHSVVGMATLIGPEWNTEPAEDKSLCDATEEYLRSKNIPDIPPGWMLLFCVLAYATPRLNHPNTRMKIDGLIHRVRHGAAPNPRSPIHDPSSISGAASSSVQTH